MSEHKSGNTTFDKALYWERRQKGLSGVARPVTVFQPVKDEEGNEQHLPLGDKTGPSGSRLMRGSHKVRNGHFTKKGHSGFVQRHMERKAGRGE